MRSWWQRRSLTVRLALWYAATTAVVLTGFAVFVYEIVEHRLIAEIDRQLRIDFDTQEAQVTQGTGGRISWSVQGAHGDEGYARLAAWFDIWSETGTLLLRHWPTAEPVSADRLPPPRELTLAFRTLELEPGLFVRVMERPARIADRGVMWRVFRDETDARHALRQIIEVALLAVPLVAFIAAVAGLLLARRALSPVGAMAAQAARVSSESLSQRLPVSNPHDELGRLATVFNQLLERLQRSFDELRRFTADASHELRTPLTALRTVGEVSLRDHAEPAALRETIESMLEEARDLSNLAESLLELTRLESGHATVRREALDLSEVAREVADTLDALATERRQRIEVQIRASSLVWGDRLLLRQAVTNVVHNALRYSPDGSSIQLIITQREGVGTLDVIDAGPGIPPELHERIFERFFRVDRARSRAQGGHGLGLAIARWAIERQGGHLQLVRSDASGSVFRIALALATVSSQKIRTPQPAGSS